VDGRSLLILLVALAAALAWWWSRDEAAVRGTAMQVDGGEQADYAMRDFLLRAMNENGRLGHTLAAENLYHYADREQSTLTRPHLMFYEEDRAVWDISAEHGLVSDSERSVLLSGDVQVHYAGTAPERSFRIHTNELHVWPEDRRAETEAAVRIVQQAGVTRSVGMRAELDLRRLHLPAQVRGQYER
jgi:lipopolysaccharide export system protein LptC